MNKELLIKAIAHAYDDYVEDFFLKAMADDEKDPEYSGIYCRNLIEALIAYEQITNPPDEIYYNNVHEYMKYSLCTDEDIRKFERKVQAEIDEFGDRIPDWKTEP